MLVVVPLGEGASVGKVEARTQTGASDTAKLLHHKLELDFVLPLNHS